MSISFGESVIKTANIPNKKPKKAFIGRLQPCTSRLPAKPAVNFDKGGSDFRCPQKTSSLGRQILSSKHNNTAGSTKFPSAPRFTPSETIGVGPCALGQSSSMRKQTLSNRRSAESTSFGTSSRDGALKMYTVYTYKRS